MLNNLVRMVLKGNINHRLSEQENFVVVRIGEKIAQITKTAVTPIDIHSPHVKLLKLDTRI